MDGRYCMAMNTMGILGKAYIPHEMIGLRWTELEAFTISALHGYTICYIGSLCRDHILLYTMKCESISTNSTEAYIETYCEIRCFSISGHGLMNQ